MTELADKIEAADYGDHYTVHPDGRVWSKKQGRWLKPYVTPRGYHRLLLKVGGVARHLRLNRVVAEAFHGPPPFADAVARHLDDDKSNNAAQNIAWGSTSDNALDAVRNGTSTGPANGRASRHKIMGSRNAQSKLTEGQVAQIKALQRQGVSGVEIAEAFGTTTHNVSLIKRGKAWRHVP